jgi:hypothetical protein
MTHDYKRNGTTTLFAALRMIDGKCVFRSNPATVPAQTRPLFRAKPSQCRSVATLSRS